VACSWGLSDCALRRQMMTIVVTSRRFPEIRTGSTFGLEGASPLVKQPAALALAAVVWKPQRPSPGKLTRLPLARGRQRGSEPL
jgi:hypothetical protein